MKRPLIILVIAKTSQEIEKFISARKAIIDPDKVSLTANKEILVERVLPVFNIHVILCIAVGLFAPKEEPLFLRLTQ